ncbi:DNA polymerase-3 subunit delta' [Neolewinella xylanilytica]|uniref:DNA polymerase-3 subunit delta n=2 Tax=Neolewinella xylanilytica TaxID=1514080 RepID=A0A2S6I2Q6_9BACT|nr:DNA polymerase-3 subunit delta' [Neolewinella xylanilytica]
MRFDQLIHQPPGLAQLRQMAAADRLPHANMLLSPPGGGGLAAALATATLLLCENRQGEHRDTPCGSCRACRKTAGCVHPDLHFAFPTVGSKASSDQFLPQWRNAVRESPYMEANDWLQRIGAENKQGNINRDNCAAILRKLNLKIFEGRYKIMLIWLPEYLGNEGNRLLKMIEEPPESTIFLLVAERLELILATILSRCQLTKLLPPNGEEIAAALRKNGLPELRATATARLAAGNYNLALSLAESEADAHGPLLLDWMRACFQGSPARLVAWTDEFAKLGRETQKHFLRYCLHFWREFLLLSVTGDAHGGVRLPEAELQSAKKMLPLIDQDQLADITGLLSECAEHVERNANPKILFMDAGIRMHQILRHRVPEGAARA